MDINSIRLTEIFEYSLISASGKSQISPLPHFQAYKLWYATYLADMGMVSHASAYVSSILAVTKALAEPCPYIHGIFGLLLKELGDRLEVMYGADCSVSNESSNSGWLGKISENFTGAALGRGLEHLMNSAVGVPSSQPKNNHAAIAPSESMNESQLNGVYLAPEGNSGNYSSMGQQSASVAQNNIYSNAAISTVGQSAPVEPYQNYTGQTYEDGVQNNIQGVYSDHLHQNYADQSYGDDAPNYTEDVYTDPPHQEYNYHTYNDNPQNYTEGAYTDNSNQDYIDRTHGNDFQSYGEEDYSGYNRNYGESPQNYLSQPLEGVSQRYSDDTYPSNSENLANQSFADSTSANPEQISPATYENNSRVLGEINPNHSTSKLPNSIPVSHIPKHPSLHGEDEDLGFGNSKKPVYAASHSEAKNSENTSSELSKENKAKGLFHFT